MAQKHSRIDHPLLLIAGLALVAANLRAPITSVGPILRILQLVFDLSPSQAGLLTTLPLLAFGLVSPFAVIFAREYGIERSLFGALLLIAAGMAVRFTGPVWCLYLGTIVIGIGIAIGNVLLPSLIKRDSPSKVATITGMSAIAMGVAAALASGSAVPLSSALGWREALATGLIFPLLAIASWIPQLARHTRPGKGTALPPHGGKVWHSALAWQVTLFMGINSLLYYVLVAWLPNILESTGVSPAVAGSLHGMMQLATAVPGLLLGPIVNRMRDQRLVAAIMGTLMGIALIGFLFAPAEAIVWSLCFGFGSGGGILLALMFMGLRTNNAHQAAALSGMAQCIGYLLAACGPTLAGRLHEQAGNWNVVLVFGAVLAVAMAGMGALAGRQRTVAVH